MAEVKSSGANSKKEYATDEQGMMADAKDYATRDMKTIMEVFNKLGLNGVEGKEDVVPTKVIVKTVVQVKYEQINHARNDVPEWQKILRGELND